MAKKNRPFVADRKFKFVAPGAAHWTGSDTLDLEPYSEGLIVRVCSPTEEDDGTMTILGRRGESLLDKPKPKE